ncbi:MAG: ABC transporter permease [Chloroflexi bacterium]|nr:ABC transporter permease [Chloroflexota bacterium]
MGRYIVRRLLLNILVLWTVATLVFIAVRLLGSDYADLKLGSNLELSANNPAAIARAKAELGLDKPKWQQYFIFLGELARGDLGTSFETRRSTWAELGERIPYTIELGTMIAILSFAISIPIGIISAVKQDTWIDYLLRGVSILAVATPVFFVAIIFTLIVLKNQLFTIQIVEAPHFWTSPKDAFFKYLIPAVAGGIAGGGGIMRLLRSQMLEVLRQDYIRTATAKGLRDRKVVLGHALKNAMIPVLTVMGLTISSIIGGQIILENMFNIRGVGNFLLSRLLVRDFPPFQGTVLVIAFVGVSVNLLVDVLYAWLDPRIRYS